MTWRTEKTKIGEDFIWEGAETGIAPSPTRGTANLQNVNLSTELGEVLASFGRVNQVQTALSSQTLTPSGTTLFDAPATLQGGQWIKVTASTVSSITAATNPTTASLDYLIVAGGGGGGGANNGSSGGGGAGGYLEDTTSLSVGSYTVTVGNGGAGGTTQFAQGTNGSDSSVSSIATATGGGGGGIGTSGATPTSLFNGKTGGSGGGGGGADTAAGTAGAGTVGQGYAGGAGRSTSVTAAAGGGGADGAAADVSLSGTGTQGGAGVSSSISGTATYYAGGGGGGGGTSGGAGGSLIGGQGGHGSAGTAGAANTGSGGGGSNSGSFIAGGAGADGIVIISYTTTDMHAIGGVITHVGSKTVHTFTTDGVFQILWINPGGLYFISYKDTTPQVKLSSIFDPYGDSVITHGTTGSVTFSTIAVVNSPIAKAIETYQSATALGYRYYILDANSYIWVYDSLVYSTTLADNGVGIKWMLTSPVDYSSEPFTGIGVLNGWLFALSNTQIFCKPTVNLGDYLENMTGGTLLNPFPTHKNYVYTGVEGRMYYTDGNFIGSVEPISSLATTQSIPNVQSYCKWTSTTTEGTITELINGSIPYFSSTTRIPAVFFTDSSGTLPTGLTYGKVYYIEYNPASQIFEVFVNTTTTSPRDITTGASGNLYFNTFYPLGNLSTSVSSTPTYYNNTQALRLPFNEIAQSLIEINTTILVGCKGVNVYPWNQIDSTPSDVIPLPEGNVTAMANVNNIAYLFAGNKGNIYVTNNSIASLALKVPDYCAGIAGTPASYIEPYYVWGDAMFVRGRLYFSILDQTATKTGNCGGIWSFIPTQNVYLQEDVGASLRLENQNSYGTYNGYATVLIPSQDQKAIAPQYWAGWQSTYTGTSYGIDFTDTVPATQYIVETDLLKTGTILQKASFSQLEYKLTAPLATGESVQLYWRTNATSAWTSAGTVKQEVGNEIAGYYNTNFQKTQWIQFRVVATTTGDSTSSFVRLSQILLR